MILVGNQRTSRGLADHLLNDRDNDAVELHELRGFVADDLQGALHETDAIARGTRAKQPLFSCSFNPPADADVATEDFEAAIDQVEVKLGLDGQPRAIVFHEKAGEDGINRRHCHAVWSRIDSEEMKAVQLSFSHRKLQDVSRELYLEHGWQMPDGLIPDRFADPTNFNLAEWQQAKRAGRDVRETKAIFQSCWQASDNQQAFTSALQERGFYLAKGDRRGHVAVDWRGEEVYAISRWAGVKAKDVRARLTDSENLPSVDEQRQALAQQLSTRLDALSDEQARLHELEQQRLTQQRAALIERQTEARDALKAEQEQRWQQEMVLRQERYHQGLRGMLDKLTGRHARIEQQNELETLQAWQRDSNQRDALIFEHMTARQQWQENHDARQQNYHAQQQELSADRDHYAQQAENRLDALAALREEASTSGSFEHTTGAAPATPTHSTSSGQSQQTAQGPTLE